MLFDDGFSSMNEFQWMNKSMNNASKQVIKYAQTWLNTEVLAEWITNHGMNLLHDVCGI
jgi:hypothetical protein